MPDRSDAGTLFDLAHEVAKDVFASDSTGANADKVCAVALSIDSDRSIAYFSGSPGYAKLVERVGGDRRQAQTAITGTLMHFLGSAEGGGFTPTQITNRGYAEHGRGAMNCAEPKVWYHVTAISKARPANWVLIPFNRLGDGSLVYNPPCRNCRRWVYGCFHTLSATIALARGGADALKP